MNNQTTYQEIKNSSNLKYLFENGLDINAQNMINFKGHSIEWLIDHNQKEFIQSSREFEEYKTFEKSKVALEQVDKFYHINKERKLNQIPSEPSLLQIAIKNQNFDLAYELIKNGANINSYYEDPRNGDVSSFMYTCTESQFYAGIRSVTCEALHHSLWGDHSKQRDRFVHHLIDMGLKFEPSLFYYFYPIAYAIKGCINPDIIKRLVFETNWHNNTLEDFHNRNLGYLSHLLKDSIYYEIKTHPMVELYREFKENRN